MSKPMTYWSITSQILKEEAEKLGLEVEILVAAKNLFFVKGKGKEILFKSNDFGGNSSLAKKIVDDKELSYRMLDRWGFPIAKTWYLDKNHLSQFDFDSLNGWYPLIIKPIEEGHGNGVRVGITTKKELYEKLEGSFHQYDRMIIQQQIHGDECRVVVLFGEVILAYNRIPPWITGNGIDTLKDSIEKENLHNPLRSQNYTSPLSHIRVDSELEDFIGRQGFILNDILPVGKSLQLRGNSNIGTGGTLREITNILHPSIRKMCSEIAEKLNMNILCVDIMSKDFTIPLEESGGIILEIGGNPGFGGHRELTSVNTAKILLQKLFFL